MASFHVDKEKCVKCGACILGCPRVIIAKDGDGYPQVLDEDEYYCMQCSHCVVNCAYGASSLGGFGHKNTEDLGRIKFPSPDEARRLLCTRRSVRKFKGRPIDRDTLVKILDNARYAPSASNRQQLRWIAAQAETLDAYKMLILEEFSKDPATRADYRFSRQEEQQKAGKDPVFRNAPMLLACIVPGDFEWKEDAIIALTYLELSAHSMGIGSCWSSIITRDLRQNQKARALLGIKNDEWVAFVMLLGYSQLGTPTLLPNKKKIDLTIW